MSSLVSLCPIWEQESGIKWWYFLVPLRVLPNSKRFFKIFTCLNHFIFTDIKNHRNIVYDLAMVTEVNYHNFKNFPQYDWNEIPGYRKCFCCFGVSSFVANIMQNVTTCVSAEIVPQKFVFYFIKYGLSLSQSTRNVFEIF